MKTVKNIMMVTLGLLVSIQIFSQDIKEHRFSPTGKLIVDGVNKVTFVGHEGNEVIISTEVSNSSKSERAEGLKLINGTGLEDNTGLGLSVTKVDGQSKVVEISSRSSRRYTIKVPKTLTVVYEHNTPFGSTVRFEKVASEIEAKTLHTKIELNDVTGPMTISSVHGNIEGNFSTVSQKGAISLASSHGLVDITIPEATKANLQLSSSWGEIYSDLSIAIDKPSQEMKNYSANIVNGAINGGGVDITISATHGNIYLRKK